MPKKPGVYHRPDNMTEALQLLDSPDSVVLAGGTKLLASESGLPVDRVVDLQGLGLNQIDGVQGMLIVGATCTLSDLAATLAQEYPLEPASALLREVIQREGPNTYRNAATLGGSIASRLPDSELLAALLVLEARLRIAGQPGAEEISLAAYLGANEQEAGLITGIEIPWTHGQGATERVARTPADYPIVSIIAWRSADGSTRLAATGIAPRPVRLLAAETAVAAGLSEETIPAAANAARDATIHPGDFRGDAVYRAAMAEVLTRRVLQELG